MTVIMQNTYEIADFQKMKVNAMKIRMVHVDGNKFHIGKEWRPQVQQFRRQLGQLLRSVSETNASYQFSKFLKFNIFDSKACLSFLNGFMMLIASYMNRLYGSVLKENVVRLFSRPIFKKPHILLWFRTIKYQHT